MVAIKDVRAFNATLKSQAPGHVSVFSGATSGLGYTTAKQLATHLTGPKMYLVGRSKAKLSELSAELQSINPEAKVEVIVAETSLIQQVDVATKEILAKESKIDLLYVSTGYLSVERNFTSEGLDELSSLRHYSRIRFLTQLLPLLLKAPNPRVVSVGAGGREGTINTSDLSLSDPKNWSAIGSAPHDIAMHTLSLEQIAKNNPTLSILHVYPGFVDTGLQGRLIATAKSGILWVLMRVFKYTLFPVVYLFTGIPLLDAGERGVYHSTSPRYPSTKAMESSLSSLKGKDAPFKPAVDNVGLYLVGENGETSKNEKVLGRYRRDGVDVKVWEHTVETIQKVLSK